MNRPSAPMIGIVVVHYGPGARTEGCLDALDRCSWPVSRRRVVVVDNGDDPDLGARLTAAHRGLTVVRSPSNVGFPAACNQGIAALGDVDHVALLNNDAVPEPGWLEPLVAAIERTGAGAVTPKVLLTGRYATVDLFVEPQPSPAGDWRELGVQVSGARLGDHDVSPSIRLAAGFWGWEHDPVTIGGRFAWTGSAATAHVPVDDADVGETLWLRLSSAAASTAVRCTSDAGTVDLEVGPVPTWCAVGRARAPRAVINNAGTVLLADGSSRDRGYLEPDDGQYDEPAAVFGWSGAAVLLAGRMLEEIGGFDERLFLFYEDTDLSLRGRLRGWTYRYEPSSVVHHAHAGAVGEDAAISRHLTSRNRALVLAKVAPRPVAVAAVAGQVRVVGAAVAHDVVGRVVRGRRPVLRHALDEARVLAGLAERLPGSLRRRRAVLRHATVRPEELWRETLAGSQAPPRRPTAISQVSGRIWEP